MPYALPRFASSCCCCCLPDAWLPLDYITLSSVQTQLAQFINMLHGHGASRAGSRLESESGVSVSVSVSVVAVEFSSWRLHSRL